MFKIIAIASIGVFLNLYCQAQQNTIIIQAHNKKVAIKDGNEGITRYWNHLEKSAQAIVFPLAKHQGERKVVFYTDIDSVVFNVKPNATYPFKVLLNNKDTCNTLLSTLVHKPTLNGSRSTIPFKLKDNNKIVVNGKVNENKELNFIIDLGARYNYLIGKDIGSKNKIVVDGHIEDESVVGLTTEATSSSNKIDLGSIVLNNVPICIINEEIEDVGLIGHRAFEGTIFELNFDEKKLLLHPQLPNYIANYTKIPIKQTTGGLYINLTINNGNKKVSGWFFIDTGADNELSVDARFAQQHQLFGTMKKIGEGSISSSGVGVVKMEVLEVPNVSISNHAFRNVPTIFAQESNAEAAFEDGVIGIGLLKRFNFIIDFENNAMYLKPNRLFDESFKKKDEAISTRFIVILAFFIFSFLGIFLYYKRKNKQSIKMKSILYFMIFVGSKNLVFAQDGNLIREKIANKTALSYAQLKEYEGVYQYLNNTTLKIAASPIDTGLKCIINESRYPFSTVTKDIFLTSTKDTVIFFRDRNNKIAGCKQGKDTFKLLSKKVNFPKNMWYARLNVPQNYTYAYKQPNNDNDGLTVGNINGSGLDKKLLAEMVEKIVGGTYPNVHSILIAKNGKLVFEEYFYEHDKNKLHELRSASKSFISALTGIAIEKGDIKSVNEKVLPYFQEYSFKNMTDEKRKITIEDLLANRSGLDCDVYNPKAFGNESEMAYKDDWIQYSLDLPMNYKAGEMGQYCSSNPIIMGRIIEKATKLPLPKFAEQTLFKDLGIKKYIWHYKTDPSSAETFCQLNLRSRDVIKFGLLYAKNGTWNGKQVISKEWIEQSWAKHSVCAGLDYGYLWWTRYLDANGTRYYGKLAQGNGGQKLYIFKELDLVVYISAGHYNMQSSSNELIAKYVLPAFNKK